MDKWSHVQWSVGLNYLIIHKLQRLHRWSWVVDQQFIPTLHNGCNYFPIPRLKLIHVNKKMPLVPISLMIIHGVRRYSRSAEISSLAVSQLKLLRMSRKTQFSWHFRNFGSYSSINIWWRYKQNVHRIRIAIGKIYSEKVPWPFLFRKPCDVRVSKATGDGANWSGMLSLSQKVKPIFDRVNTGKGIVSCSAVDRSEMKSF